MVTSGVGYMRNEAGALLAAWFLIRDAIEGEVAIKGQYAIRPSYLPTSHVRYMRKAEDYLPKPNPSDRSQENEDRYKSYVKRAVWYNFTSRTLAGLVGQIFLRPPVQTLPDELEPLVTNADGNGMTLEQVAKRTSQSTLAYGRSGLLTDFPATDESGLTPDQIKTQNIQPVIKHYHPWQIINWATTQRGAKHVLSLVVLEEVNLVEIDDFSFADEITYRVLRLDPKTFTYSVEIWGPNDREAAKSGHGMNKDQQFSSRGTYVPKDSAGKTFDEIPFQFVGSEANDIWCDIPPLYDLASLNIAHYRNSADYEEASFIVGQPTPVITGVTEQWVETVLKGQIQLGSRGSISLPVGGDAKLLQATPNQMPLEAMKMKEEQALSLGAKLVQKSKTVRTATEVMIDTTSETSTLHNVAKNTSAGMEQALKWACRFAGADDADIQYQLNTEFELTRMNANDRLALVKMWQSGAIAFVELRDALRIDGTATLDDETAMAMISKEQAAAAGLNGPPIADPLQATAPTAPENTPAPIVPPANPKPGQPIVKKGKPVAK
jgi:hypothetical protein